MIAFKKLFMVVDEIQVACARTCLVGVTAVQQKQSGVYYFRCRKLYAHAPWGKIIHKQQSSN